MTRSRRCSGGYGCSPPIFSGGVERLASDWKVEIPDAFYKVYLSNTQPPVALAFIIPQTVTGDEPLAQFVTSIDAVEAGPAWIFSVIWMTAWKMPWKRRWMASLGTCRR